jgi:hypothetical protein
MLKALCSRLLFVAFAAMVPVVSYQTVSACCRDRCCRTCRQTRCCCARPAVPQASCQAVVETQLTQQPVLQQRDVQVTEYRNEPVSETVPSTIYENVLVDEGSYQSVWVPRLTTKSVARTVYQTRTSYRTVPYQVTRRISEYGTQTVPTQTVRYVPTTPGTIVSAYPYSYSPPTTISSAPPVPDPRTLDTAATPITPRATSNSDAGRTSSSVQSASRGPAMFAPAPSAAQVWRTPRGTVAR